MEARVAIFPYREVGAVLFKASLGLLAGKATLRGVQLLHYLFGFTPGGLEKQRRDLDG